MADKTNQETNISVADKIKKDLLGMHIDVAEGNPSQEEKQTSSVNPESLVGEQVRERLTDEEDDSITNKKMKLDQLQKQCCGDANAESPALSSSRGLIMQDLVDECNSTDKAEIAIDDDKTKTDKPLRTEPKYRPLRVGFRFRPTDFHLLNDFLKKKALGQPMKYRFIPEEYLDIFSKSPRELPGYPKEKHWYYFSKKPNGQNPKNLWTQIGEATIVFDPQENGVGIKRPFTLTEQEEESSDICLSDEEEPPKEEWFMDVISLLSTVADTDWVVCHVFLNWKVKKQESFDSDEEI